MPEAKAKVRKRHEIAITRYILWLEAEEAAGKKPKRARRVRMFDSFVDGANLDEMLKRKNVKHTRTF